MWGKVPAHLEVLGPDYTDEKDSIWTMHMSLRLLDDSQVEVTRHLAHLRDVAKKYDRSSSDRHTHTEIFIGILYVTVRKADV